MPRATLMKRQVLRHACYDVSADVYSFAMILFELLTHQHPFADRAPLQAAAAAALQNTRPPLPPGVPARLQALIAACWAEEPAQRPSFRECLAALAELGPSLSAAEAEWLDEPAGHPVYAKDEEGNLQLRATTPPPAAARARSRRPSSTSAKDGRPTKADSTPWWQKIIK